MIRLVVLVINVQIAVIHVAVDVNEIRVVAVLVFGRVGRNKVSPTLFGSALWLRVWPPTIAFGALDRLRPSDSLTVVVDLDPIRQGVVNRRRTLKRLSLAIIAL